MVERLLSYTSRHPRLFDAVVAVFWTLVSVGGSDDGADDIDLAVVIPVAIALGIALFWRRRYPVHVFAFHAAVVIGMTIIDVDENVPGALFCATYSLAAHTPQRRLSIAGVTTFVAIGFATVLITSPEYIPDTLGVVLLLAIAWVIGDSLRTRRAYQQSVLERAERAEALRDSLAQQAVTEERTRIARDLHDVVAHSMSLMVVQAGAARRVAATDPDATVAALEAIESVGRNSLDEMRRILGVLRGDDQTSETAPQPDIAAIDGMVDEFRAAGLPVTVTHTGSRRPLPATVELTVFRIVQESLTNTLKHAGPAAATVVIDYDDSNLHVVVEDDGRSLPVNGADASSHKGHIGMRERVAAFGGYFTARPRLDGGYHVSATLPLSEATP